MADTSAEVAVEAATDASVSASIAVNAADAAIESASIIADTQNETVETVVALANAQAALATTEAAQIIQAAEIAIESQGEHESWQDAQIAVLKQELANSSEAMRLLTQRLETLELVTTVAVMAESEASAPTESVSLPTVSPEQVPSNQSDAAENPGPRQNQKRRVRIL